MTPVWELLKYTDGDNAEPGLLYNMYSEIAAGFMDLPDRIAGRRKMRAVFEAGWTKCHNAIIGGTYVTHPRFHHLPGKRVDNNDTEANGIQQLIVGLGLGRWAFSYLLHLSPILAHLRNWNPGGWPAAHRGMGD